ncbi:MAG: pyruvate, water dikinase [Candidatus Desulfofervidaceae bacterium]|nr:pyruvate, water dikinase [Candidatus Desulfofervidaceae bacterium]
MLSIVERLKSFFSRRKTDRKAGEIVFRSIFTRFRELLDGNNQALELIADMGDKLSGDYIFDKVYIINTYQALADTVYKVIYNLNMIVSNRYINLYDVFENINAEIKAILEGRFIITTDRFVIPLKEINESLVDAVGNKAATLGELKNRLQLKTPGGFAITTNAYKQFLDYNDVPEKIGPLLRLWEEEGEEFTEKISKQIQRLFINGNMPPEIKHDIDKVIEKTIKDKKEVFFAVRSSAVGEDAEHSFAGQFESVLGVKKDKIIEAYKHVIASLFSPRALIYCHQTGYAPQEMAMGVLCLEMVPAKASGVIYTTDPNNPTADVLLINANWGLGKTVVEGSASLDRYKISKTHPYPIIEERISSKKTMVTLTPEGKLKEREAPSEPCLTKEEIHSLVEAALIIERYFKKPQDIEWCFDQNGKLYILQTRPLRGVTKATESPVGLSSLRNKYRVLLEKKGVIAQRGIGAGTVYQVHTEEDLLKFPQGAVLVTRKTSPRFGRIMHKISGIVTDIGSPTGHMASLAREFRVPTIVDTDIATQILETGMEVTVDAEENVVYEGIVKELLNFYFLKEPVFEETYEYKLLKRILDKVAPLNLTDPQAPNFKPEGCKTFHDILRFAHEKAVAELIDIHMDKTLWKNVPAKKLKTKIPLDLVIIDLGGGLDLSAQGKTEIKPEEVVSLPMRALWKGLSAPGVWRTEPIPVDLKAIMSSMTSTFQSLTSAPRYLGCNLAVISKEYLNLSLRLGYHFNMIDTYLSDNMIDNYIYFRFLGGVTDITRRSRRARLLAEILERYDFRVEIKGDLVVGRIREISKGDTEERLQMIGRLIGFTRQLDVMMRSNKAVEHYVKMFLENNYKLH